MEASIETNNLIFRLVGGRGAARGGSAALERDKSPRENESRKGPPKGGAPYKGGFKGGKSVPKADAKDNGNGPVRKSFKGKPKKK